jgi:GntR family transcriptional regulator of arabinose operon
MSEIATKPKKSRSTRVPKYVSIAESVKADIARGALLPNDRLPSFTSMTQQFNVTIHTIDKAHAVLEQEGFVRREPGRGVFVEPQKRQRTGNIGLLLRKTDDRNWYTRSVLDGMQEKVRKHDLNLMLVDEFDPTIPKKTDGILLYCRSIDVVPQGLPASMPKVLILEHATNVDIANVVADDFLGAKLATQHLLKLGHRRISFMLSYVHDPYAVHRLAGHRAALEEAGVAFEPERVFYTVTKRENFYQNTEDAMNRWLENGWRELQATAILAPNDDGAIGIMHSLEKAGIRVPDDVSLIGFDGQPEHFHSMPLTTIRVPLREIGALSVDLLWEQIQNGGANFEKIVAPVELVEGATTTPPK